MGETQLFWTAVGSITIAVGSAIAGLYSFRGDIGIVMVGFLLFIMGYRVSQIGAHNNGNGFRDELIPSVESDSRKQIFSRATLLVVGWISIASGVTLFSQTILDPAYLRAALSGIASIGGYMCAHVGLNGAGLGDSIFGPVQAYLESESDDL